MSASPPAPRTIAELRASDFVSCSLREELRTNLVLRIRSGKPLFAGVMGFDDSVIPGVQNAILCGHDLIFLGERGQAKSRMIRALVEMLDEWTPEIAGSEVRDDPFAPISAFGRKAVAEHGDACEIAWVHRDDRYVEKLATPDTSIADLIGDVDPVKVAEGRSLGDEETIHFGLVPRTNRGIFCINELPDLTEKVQVGLFNVMEERDIQVKGYRVRLPMDVLIVASANPEDYTSRGRIITPLKDRYKAQVRTHYPREREHELAIVHQEAVAPGASDVEVFVPGFMDEIIGAMTFEARLSPDVNQSSGVSVRMSIANYETLMASAVLRAVRLGESEAVPRISDLQALEASTAGKIELEYAGAERSEFEVIREIMQRAVKVVFDEVLPLDGPALEGIAPVIESFEKGWRVEVSSTMPSDEYLAGLDEIAGLRAAAARLAGGESPARLASAIEFILEGLHLSNRLNKDEQERGALYGKA